MKEAIVKAGPKVEILDKEIPTPPSPNHLVIKVVVSGTNPKDWKVPEWMPDIPPSNQGDDIAGIVHSVGDAVTEFKPGDRVAAFHEMGSPGGSWAEYAVAYEHTTFHLPEKTTFEEAATIPLAAMTAALALFQELDLPLIWSKKTSEHETNTPVLIYGAASAVGSFAIKFLKAAKVGPVIGVAGNGIQHVESLINKETGDTIVDYRGGDEKVVEDIKKALKGKKLLHALDAVSSNATMLNVYKVLDKSGKFTTVLPGVDLKKLGIPDEANTKTMVGTAHIDQTEPGDRLFAYALFRSMAWGLKEGWFSGHPYKVVEGGLNGVEQALKDLKDGKVSAYKYVLRIGETLGL